MKAVSLDQNARVLIILMGSLGDVVRGLHIADCLREAYPNMVIDWLIEPKCEGIVRVSPSVSKVIVFNRKRLVYGTWELFRALRNAEYDVVLDLQRHFKSGVFAWMTGAKRRIGFPKNMTKEGNFLFSTETIEAPVSPENKFLTYRRFLSKLGISIPSATRTKLIPTDLDRNLSLPSRPYIFVVLGSSWASKNWQHNGYEQVLESLARETSCHFVLVGGQDQYEVSITIELNFRLKERLCNLVGKTSLPQLIHTIEHSIGGFGPDSGPGHIAAAFGKPYVALFGPTDPTLVSPIGMESLVVRSGVGCSPCYKRECPGLGEVCMKAIPPATITGTLLKALSSTTE